MMRSETCRTTSGTTASPASAMGSCRPRSQRAQPRNLRCCKSEPVLLQCFLLPRKLRIKCRVCSAAGEEDPFCTYVHICTIASCIKPTSLLLHGAGYSAWSLSEIISTLKPSLKTQAELFLPFRTLGTWRTCTVCT